MIYYNDGEILIRDMLKSDAQIITDEEIAQGWDADVGKYEMRLRHQSEGKSVSIVAEYQGNIAGYINVYPASEWGAFAGQGYPEIVDFGVLAKYRRHGIGSRLMDIAEQIASGYSDIVYLGVGMHSGYGSAQRMYVKRGYIPDGTGVWYGDKVCEQYAGWYKADCDMMTLRQTDEKMPLEKACVNALLRGITLLLNNGHCGEDKMQGHGMVIYRNWGELLREENQRNADQIECVFPHAFIHYENKLRTKQFFELCINIIPDIDKELMVLAISQYNDIISFATKIATIAHQRDSFPKDSLKEKRNQIIDMLRRSSE